MATSLVPFEEADDEGTFDGFSEFRITRFPPPTTTDDDDDDEEDDDGGGDDRDLNE